MLMGHLDTSDLADITKMLPAPSSLAGYRLTPVDFEKDDDSNHHIDFITRSFQPAGHELQYSYR